MLVKSSMPKVLGRAVNGRFTSPYEGEGRKNITLRLSPDAYEKIREIALQRNVTVGTVIEVLLEAYQQNFNSRDQSYSYRAETPSSGGRVKFGF